ncbi:MAG TPA: extracellular solute-binding protein [Chloroflexota bacterium]|nr:extracellular solute-binding protein [Chloroflexota bacterium]
MQTTIPGRMATRRGVVAGGGVLGALSLAACGGPAATPAERVDTNPAGGGQLQWWIIGGQPQVEILEGQVLPDYKRERPQVAVSLTSNASWNDHNTKLLAAMAAATPPDVARVKDYWTSDYQSRGALAELDPYVKADKLDLVARHGAARLVSTQEAGRTYALPFTTVTLHQFFNPELLREYGFVKGDAPTPPETWNERREMARRMTDRTRERWGNMMYAYSTDQSTTTDFMQWVLQNGVEWMSKDLTRFTFNTPEGVETLQYLQDLIWKDQTTIPPGYAIQNPRETGKVALWMGGSWNIPEFRRNFPDMKFMTALNPEKKTRTLMLQANNQVLFREGKARDLAWTLLRHMNKESSDLAWNGAAGYLPVALANFDKPPFGTDPAWQVVTRQVRRPDSKPYPIVTNYQEMMNVIGEELVRAFRNEKVAKEALGEAHRRAQELLDKEVARRKP